jgi:hypothetical protein
VFEEYFSVNTNAGGKGQQTIDLKPNGRDIKVVNLNKKEFVKLL